MREALETAIREASLLAIAAAFALVWTFIDLAQALGSFTISVFTEVDADPQFPGFGDGRGPLTWEVGDRLINFASLVYSGVAFGATLLFAWIVLGRRQRL